MPNAGAIGDLELAAQTRARAHQNAGHALANGAFTIVNFNVVDEDTEGCITTGAAWKFTAKRAGRYDVRASQELVAIVGAGGVGARALICVFKNGAEWMRGSAESIVAGTVPNLHVASLVDLVAGDFIDIRIFQNSGGAEATQPAGPSLAMVQIQRIGP